MLITNSYILHKNKPVLPHWSRNSRILRRGTRINPSSVQGVVLGVYRGCKEATYFWRATRINSFGKKSRTTWEIEMKLWHSQQNYLRNISRSKSHLSKVSAHVQMTHFSTWPHFTNLLQYLAFEIDFLVYEVGDMLRPWNFLENVFWQRKLIGEAIVSFCWRHQNWFPVCIVHASHVT